MGKKYNIYLHTGTNLGDRIANLELANQLIEAKVGKIEVLSSYYTTAAWGIENQPDFINQAIRVSTSLSPRDLLKAILAIEIDMGRVRVQKWGERLIDIDILFYENQVINEPNLVIPHPYLHQRNFVLVPLQEIAADFIHPVQQQTIQQLLDKSTDKLAATLYEHNIVTTVPNDDDSTI